MIRCTLTPAMFLQDYDPQELRFAYSYHLYARWRTYRNRPITALSSMTATILSDLAQPYKIHVLECAADEQEVMAILSLQPTDSVSVCVSKLKGRVSKWLSSELALMTPTQLLSRGYFATTVGKAKSTAVDEYLSRQGLHHGYSGRLLPPVFVKTYLLMHSDETLLMPKHGISLARFHLVLSTYKRQGVFTTEESKAVASVWRSKESDLRFRIEKVSFIPDHVHVALRLHPAVAPATVVALLMSSAQRAIPNQLVATGLNQLWQPSAYLGSLGDLTTPQVRKYMERFLEGAE